MAVYLDTSRRPEDQGFVPVTTGGRCDIGSNEIIITDDSVSHHYYYKEYPHLAEQSVLLHCHLRISYTRLYNNDTGVCLVIDQGQGKKRIEVCFRQDSRGPIVCFRNFIDGEYSFSRGAVIAWGSGAVFDLRVAADGAAELLINGTSADNLAAADALPSYPNASARFEFGCYSDQAEVTAGFLRLEEEVIPQTYPLAVRTINVQLFPQWANLVELTAEITLDASSPGIDPAADGIGVTLSFAGGDRYYPIRYNTPIYMTPTADGWRINDDQRRATGVEMLRLCRTRTEGKFLLLLADMQTNLANGDYRHTTVTIESGRNRGSQALTLQGGDRWYHLP